MSKKTIVTVEEFKESNTKLLQQMLTVQGGIDPIVTGLIIRPNGEYAIAVYPLPKEAFESDENKKKVPGVIKILFESFKRDGITPVCFSFTSEAWLRILDKDQKMPTDGWKKLPSKEAFITTYETADETDLRVNLIHREGKIANAKGELIDAIRLERVKEMEEGKGGAMCGGTFMNMFRDQFKNFKEDGKSTD